MSIQALSDITRVSSGLSAFAPSGGGSFSAMQNECVIDFGTTGLFEGTVFVAETNIPPTAVITAHIKANATTADHTPADHRFISCITGLTCMYLNTGGFSVFMYSTQMLTGKYAVQWCWVDVPVSVSNGVQ